MSELRNAVAITEIMAVVFMYLEDVAEDPTRLVRAQELVGKEINEIMDRCYGPTSP